MATKLNTSLKEQVERYKKAARASEAVRRMRETNNLTSGIAAAGRELKNQSKLKQ